jgi:hypothetical protein
MARNARKRVFLAASKYHVMLINAEHSITVTTEFLTIDLVLLRPHWGARIRRGSVCGMGRSKAWSRALLFGRSSQVPSGRLRETASGKN